MAGAATILQQPDAVAATPSGEVIVADVGDRRLQVCQRQPAGCCSALHACSDGAGSCDQAKGPRSSLFHPVCPLLQQPNNQPTSHPTDPWLQVFSAVDGAFLRTLGGPMLFFRIRGLGVHHATGCIYVADALMNRVVVLSPEGEVVAHFGHRGSGDGDLERCAGLCVRVQSVCNAAGDFQASAAGTAGGGCHAAQRWPWRKLVGGGTSRGGCACTTLKNIKVRSQCGLAHAGLLLLPNHWLSLPSPTYPRPHCPGLAGSGSRPAARHAAAVEPGGPCRGLTAGGAVREWLHRGRAAAGLRSGVWLPLYEEDEPVGAACGGP